MTTKKIIVLLFMAIALLASAAARAEAGSGPAAVLENEGIEPVQFTQWGNTAACFAEDGGVKRLIVLERQSGDWKIVINNPTALIPDMDWPELLLDSDYAIFWTYRQLSEEETVRYHSSRGMDGVWGPVDQYYTDSGFGGEIRSRSTAWDEANGGEIIHTYAVSDENDNMQDSRQEILPAAWMKDSIRLADFDVTRFPVMIGPPYYNQWFEGEGFIRDAAAFLMPDCEYIKGILKDGDLHFLMRKPDGTKAYVICEYASHRAVNLITSPPLPEETILGYENFTDSLWISPCCVPIHLLGDRETMGIEYIYSEAVYGRNGGFLSFGDRAVWTDVIDDMILYGDHPWYDIRTVDWNNLPGSIDEAAARMDSAHYAVVNNPDPTDRLHMREKADRESRSLGKYYNGTPVTILAEEGDWALVAVGSGPNCRRGYMMKKYLAYGRAGKALRLDLSALPQLMPRSETLRVYEKPQEGQYETRLSRAVLKVIGVIGQEWVHVWFPATGDYGFVRRSELWEGNG